jgi:hypothetical protein
MAGLLDFLQSASNAAASNVSGPVDLLQFMLQKAGVPVRNAVGSSDWMKSKGLMRDVPQSAASLAGETVGLLSPMVAAAKAPQIAGGLLATADDFHRYNKALGPAGASYAVKPSNTQNISAVNFDEDLLKSAMADTKKAPPLILSDLDADAMGVIRGRARQLDKAINRGTYKESDLQDAWAGTRGLLKTKYGNAVKLYRADAPKSDHAADTLTVYMADQKIAERFANNGRQVAEHVVPIDDILAVYARPSGYYEAIVRRSAIEGGGVKLER